MCETGGGERFGPGICLDRPRFKRVEVETGSELGKCLHTVHEPPICPLLGFRQNPNAQFVLHAKQNQRLSGNRANKEPLEKSDPSPSESLLTTTSPPKPVESCPSTSEQLSD